MANLAGRGAGRVGGGLEGVGFIEAKSFHISYFQRQTWNTDIALCHFISELGL